MCEPCGDLPTLPVVTAAKKTECLRGCVRVFCCAKTAKSTATALSRVEPRQPFVNGILGTGNSLVGQRPCL